MDGVLIVPRAVWLLGRFAGENETSVVRYVDIDDLDVRVLILPGENRGLGSSRRFREYDDRREEVFKRFDDRDPPVGGVVVLIPIRGVVRGYVVPFDEVKRAAIEIGIEILVAYLYPTINVLCDRRCHGTSNCSSSEPAAPWLLLISEGL